MAFLIAEIGNNHFGSMAKAKELVAAAVESGASIIKGQAMMPGSYQGSMPEMFYRQCCLKEYQYAELIEYARSLNVDMFYSLFVSDGNALAFEDLAMIMRFQKIPAFCIKNNFEDPMLKKVDNLNTIVSVPMVEKLPDLALAQILHVSDYLAEDPHLERILFLRKHYNRRIGYSDHTIGIEACVRAVKQYDAPIIEKHFTLTKKEKWYGEVFRDTVHGATPDELNELSKEIGGRDAMPYLR